MGLALLMKLEDIKEEHLVKIVGLYEQHCGEGRNYADVMCHPPERALIELKENFAIYNISPFRLGSKWDWGSKLCFRKNDEGEIEVQFSPNFDPREDKGMGRGKDEYEAAEKAGKDFQEAVRKYLSNPESY